MKDFKKGFTLVELLAAITVLGLILLIAIPTISSTITNSKDRLYLRQIESIEGAGRVYQVKNRGETYVSIQTLVDEKYLTEMPIDPRNDTAILGGVTLTDGIITYVP